MAHGKWSHERRHKRNQRQQMIYGQDASLDHLITKKKKDKYGKKEDR